jgi:hypothetical protein
MVMYGSLMKVAKIISIRRGISWLGGKKPHRVMATIDPDRPVSTLRTGHPTSTLSRARRHQATTLSTCRQANSVRNESGMPIPTMSVTSCGSRS